MISTQLQLAYKYMCKVDDRSYTHTRFLLTVPCFMFIFILMLLHYIQRENFHKLEGIGKAIPLQAWTGPEGSRRLRLRDFKTNGT